MNTYFKLLKFAQPIGKYIIPYTIFSILGAIFSLINLALLAPLLDVLFGTEKKTAIDILPEFSFNFNYFIDLFYYYLHYFIASYGKFGAIQFVCIVLVSSVFLSNIFKYLNIRILESLRARTIKNIRQTVFRSVTSLHLGYFSEQRKGDLMARMTTDIYEMEYSITNSLFMLLKEPITLIIFFVALFNISWHLTLFTLIIIPVSGGAIAVLIGKLKKYADRSQESISATTSILDETIGGLRVIKAFNALPYIWNKFDRENNYYAKSTKKLAYIRELSSPLSEFLGVATVSFILLYGGSLVLQENPTLTADAFIVYIGIFSQIISPAKGITVAIANIQRGLVCGKRVLYLIEAQAEVADKEDVRALDVFKHEIEFKNVSFKYENDWVLKDISFKIEKGKTIALVGQSGGGKSTIADLVPRFYDVQEGGIFIDGINIKDYQLESLLDKMGIVTQESILFNDTVFNNIAFGKPESVLEDVIQAARVANAHDFIMQMEKGYDTVIGDRGMKLSGGQKQRLSIARAVFKNPPILILDEATSALDTESEKLVQDALNNLMKNRTSLVIAHRLSTIQHADEILVIEKGEIVERGDHASLLLNEDGVYKKLNLMQTI